MNLNMIFKKIKTDMRSSSMLEEGTHRVENYQSLDTSGKGVSLHFFQIPKSQK